jgi:hypothetical protein
LHAGGDAGFDVVGDGVELDDAAEDFRGVLGGVQEPGDEYGLVPSEQLGVVLQRQRLCLSGFGAGA